MHSVFSYQLLLSDQIGVREMHIYAFGSICRGDVSRDSDVDLLAVVEAGDEQLSPDIYSIYSYRRTRELWEEGNPFAWHLALESRMLFSSDSKDYLKELASPNRYRNCFRDCQKFHALFQESYKSLMSGKSSRVFDLSTIFLSVRNLATCFSLGVTDCPDFSRHAAIHLGTRNVRIAPSVYRILERARILCTRGIGAGLTVEEIECASMGITEVNSWMIGLIEEVARYERVQ